MTPSPMSALVGRMGAPGSKDVDLEGMAASAVGTAKGFPVSSFEEQEFPLASLVEAYGT